MHYYIDRPQCYRKNALWTNDNILQVNRPHRSQYRGPVDEVDVLAVEKGPLCTELLAPDLADGLSVVYVGYVGVVQNALYVGYVCECCECSLCV